MLKEMTVLLIVLWGSQGMPTTTRSQKQDLQELIRLYCKAEELLWEYKSEDKKHLPSEVRSKMRSDFSHPGCNFTESAAEECQILWEFKELFVWLKDIHQEDGLLKPVMRSFTLLIELQSAYVNHTCFERIPDKIPQFNCPKYSEGDAGPARENMFHYIFELFKTLTRNFLSSKLKLGQANPSEVCKAMGD